MQSLLKFSSRTIIIVLIISISILSSELYAQNSLRIFDVPGGSGSSTTQSDDSNDDTFLYVAGGLIIAGILVYALVIKKDNKAKEDTTASLNSNLIYSEAKHFDSAEELQKVKDKIPVDIFLGIRNNEAIMNDKTYLVGVSISL